MKLYQWCTSEYTITNYEFLIPTSIPIRLRRSTTLSKIQGWVEQSETQQRLENVGLPCGKPPPASTFLKRQVLQRREPPEVLIGGSLRSDFSPQRTGSPTYKKMAKVLNTCDRSCFALAIVCKYVLEKNYSAVRAKRIR